jgi:hypothetical protein
VLAPELATDRGLASGLLSHRLRSPPSSLSAESAGPSPDHTHRQLRCVFDLGSRRVVWFGGVFPEAVGADIPPVLPPGLCRAPLRLKARPPFRPAAHRPPARYRWYRLPASRAVVQGEARPRGRRTAGAEPTWTAAGVLPTMQPPVKQAGGGEEGRSACSRDSARQVLASLRAG